VVSILGLVLRSLGSIVHQNMIMTHAQIGTEFVAEFCEATKLRRVSLEDFAAAEREIGTVFPAAYVSFLTHFGFGAIPCLAGLAREAAVWPMTHLLSPLEAVAASRIAWQAGMQRHLVAIARSEDNDLLCFHRARPGQRRVEEALWTFLRDSGEIVRAFDSFYECLREYRAARYERDE